MQEHEKIAGAEKAPKARIILPKGWGNGNLSPDVQFALMMNPSLEEEAKKRAKVDKEMREMMDELGIHIDERDYKTETFTPDEEQNEYTMIARKDEIGDELKQVKEAVPEIKIPKTFSMDEFEEGIPLPVVAIFGSFSGGTGKYLIETEEQRSSLIGLCNSEDGKQLNKKDFVFKEFIETPDEHFTSYRVIVSATGKIMASSLLYSGHSEDKPEYTASGLDPTTLGVVGHSLLDYLENEKSPYYLRSRKFTSNIHSGGGCIPLNPNENSRTILDGEKDIMRNHGIGKDAELPKEIADQAMRIGASLGRKMGLSVGVDFIQDRDGNFYYLETNAGHGVETYLASHSNGEGDVEIGYRMAMRDALLELVAQKTA